MARDKFCLNREFLNNFDFLSMPVSAQMLYVRLCAAADDDGIAQAYNVMRLTGTSIGDLEVLVNRQFVYILDSHGYIIYIEDWLEHNNFRSDRKVDSRHLALLLQKRPDVKVLIGTERADTGKRTGRPSDVKNVDNLPIKQNQTKGNKRNCVIDCDVDVQWTPQHNTRQDKTIQCKTTTNNVSDYIYSDVNNSDDVVVRCVDALVRLSFSVVEARAVVGQYGAQRVQEVLAAADRPGIDSPVGWVKAALAGGWSVSHHRPDAEAKEKKNYAEQQQLADALVELMRSRGECWSASDYATTGLLTDHSRNTMMSLSAAMSAAGVTPEDLR